MMGNDLLRADRDTIVARATAEGRGALALIRVSGPDAMALVGRLASPWPLEPRRATVCELREPEGDGARELEADGARHAGAPLDEAVVTCFPAPHSYTGEDVVELSTHGGLVVPASVIAALVRLGARPARPGEFSWRAVLNGRMDLLQAEAVGDLIDARSSAMQRVALVQLGGALSRRVVALREALLSLEALLAYDIDFPEEDDGPVSRERIDRAVAETLAAIGALLATTPAAALVRDGAVVVVAGPPNAGKSSLFNALLGQERAIVTAIPGTTRDAIEAVLDTRPWPLRLVDTAGLRETQEVVERLGIEVSERYVAQAELVLACGETPADVQATVERVRDLAEGAVLGVWTKRDAATADEFVTEDESPMLAVSAHSGRGLRELMAQVQEALRARHATPERDAPLVTRARQRRQLEVARSELTEFAHVWGEDELPATVAAVHVRAAVGALEELVGVVDVEEVLGRVFSEFCVGK